MLQFIVECLLYLALLGGLIYWVTHPSEWLSAAPNNLYAVGIGNRPWFIINGDNLQWFASKIPIVKPFRIIPVKLIWNEYFTEEEKRKEKVGNSIGENRPDDLRYKNIIVIPGKNGFLGKREEWVRSIRIDERAQFLVDVDSKDGYNFKFLITLILRVITPISVFRRSTIFKMVGQDLLDTSIEPWGYGQTLDQIKDTNLDLITDPIRGISIMVNNEEVDLVTYLNKLHFSELGFKTSKQYLSILEGENVQQYYELKRKEEQQGLQLKVVQAYDKTRTAERKIEKDDAHQETDIMGERMERATKEISPILTLAYAGQAHVAKQRPFVSVEVKTGTDGDGLSNLVNTIASIIPKENKTKSKTKFENDENK